jgi:hypothetical protein
MWIPDHERRAQCRNTGRMGCERVNGGGNGEVLLIRDVNLDDCDRGVGMNAPDFRPQQCQ